MKPKPEVDPDFAPAPWRSISRTVARWLLIVTVITGAIAPIPAEPTRAPQASAQGATPAPENLKLTLQQLPPAAPVAVAAPQPRDGFVVMASPSIDPLMVQPAPEGIDEGMVVRFRDRRSAPAILVEPPRNKSRELPVPVPPNSEDPDAKPDPEVLPNEPLPAKPR